MTPAQLDHLSRLKHHLETLLANAAKRTPGRWVAGATIVGNGVDTTVCEMPFQSKNSDWTSNMVFIASCAGNAEAGWESTLRQLKLAFDMSDIVGRSQPGLSCDLASLTFERVYEDLAAAWPTENLP